MASWHRIVLPVPFPLQTVNAWLLPGRRPVLVDCGLGSSRSYQGLLEGLRKHGADPKDLDLYITHGHVDHAGNARRLRDDFGVELWAPPEEAPFVATFRRDSSVRNDGFAEALVLHGMPQDDVARLRADSDAIDRFLEDVPISHPVAEEERTVLGDHEALLFRTPGHTPGSTCFLLDENTLLTGDTLLESITSNAIELHERDFGSYHQYVQSVARLREYAGCTALPGHKEPFTITEDLIDSHLDAHKDRAKRILDALETPRTAYEVLRACFPQWQSDPQLFMGMAEVVGHLHALELDGAVERVEREENGVRRFRRVEGTTPNLLPYMDR